MRKFVFRLLLAVMCTAMLLPACALAEGIEMTQETEFFTWAGLSTMSGAVGAVLLIVQLIKAPLDKVWKIPTRILVYVIALVILMGAQVINGTITWESTGLAILNAFQVAFAAMGLYEATFKKTDVKSDKPPDVA